MTRWEIPAQSSTCPTATALSSAKAKTLVEDPRKPSAMSIGAKSPKASASSVNNRLVEASDPTLSMPTARHTRHPAIQEAAVKTSRLVATRIVPLSVLSGATEVVQRAPSSSSHYLSANGNSRARPCQKSASSTTRTSRLCATTVRFLLDIFPRSPSAIRPAPGTTSNRLPRRTR